ncbi:MAG TPA: MBL fold metallo-hydrolase [Geminicoccaceae bacterium]|nr:MBL fold metallo-hydrolase [Geminicoccaceae bacterium]
MAVTITVDQAASDLTRLRFLFVNVYLCGTPASWVLIDAGLRGAAGTIMKVAAERFGAGNAPQAIVLTHGHFDHVGALPGLLEHWDVPVYAHRLELPHLTGQADYPPPDPTVGKGAMALMSIAYPNAAIDLGARVRPLPDDGSVPHMPGWRWIHTPGHTAGHVSLFREADRCLIAGDAFVTVKQESLYAVATQEREVHGPPAYFTPDWANARRSVERLVALDPAIAATGHGTPMRDEELRDGLARLVRRFDRVAVPDQGRYVR